MSRPAGTAEVDAGSSNGKSTGKSSENLPVAQPSSSPRIQIDPFDPTTSNWNTYLKRLRNKLTLYAVTPSKQVLYLLDSIGEQAYERLCDLCEPIEPETKSFEDISTILSSYFQPEPNTLAERVKFQSRMQGEGETPAEYAAELKKLTRYCKFPTVWFDDALCTQFVHGLTIRELKLRIMELSKVSFSIACDFAHSYYILRFAGSPTASSTLPAINYVARSNNKSANSKYKKNKKCVHCNYSNHVSEDCKFKDATCNLCGVKGHISPICGKKNKGEKKFFAQKKSSDGNNKRSSVNMISAGANSDSLDLLPDIA